MNPDCEICALLRDPQNDVTVLTTEHWRVVLCPDQAYLGRAWVTLKTHASSIPELSKKQWDDLHRVIAQYEDLVKKAFDAQLFNWVCLMNDAFKESKPTPHVHWHVRPRYDHDVTVAGEMFRDPNFAHHYTKDVVKLVDEKVVADIREALQSQA